MITSDIRPLLLFLAVLLQTARLNASAIEPANCVDFINEQPGHVTCGFITQPVDHQRKDDGSVTLPVLIARAHQSTRANRAILIPGAGGPGAAMGFGYRYRRGEFLQPYEGLLAAGYDLVMLDQRGAGLSTPRLTCFESIAVFKHLVTRKRSIDEEISRYHQSAEQCHTRLRSHHLEHFDTLQSARDFLAVMKSLNYDWWGTISTSFATVVTQTMLGLNPDAFDKVVLDSPVPLDYQKPLTSESTYQAILKSIDRCRLTSRCHQRYPLLRQVFDRLISRAADTPYQISINVLDDSFRQQKATLVVNDDTLLAIFANAIYSNEGIASLPSVISAMDLGRTKALRYFAEDFWYQSTDDTYADGLNLTVHCKERQSLENEYLKANPDYFASLSLNTRMLMNAQRDLCDRWGVSANDQLEQFNKISTPTLILSGSLDPVISTDDIGNTIDNFSIPVSRAEIKGAGHAVWYQSACVREAVVEYFNDQPLKQLSQCQLEVPPFR